MSNLPVRIQYTSVSESVSFWLRDLLKCLASNDEMVREFDSRDAIERIRVWMS